MSMISKPGISAGRLAAQDYLSNFTDLHPPLGPNKAKTEADRCYYCYEAPCMQACPTSIDIPRFIRQIAAANPIGAADTIFSRNIMGGMCARVCPTETLCEEVCVHVEQGNLPVKIGELQRFATDRAMSSGGIAFNRAAVTGKRVAVIGAGPAGLSCAHRLAARGHGVTILEAKDKPGGLNEYGLAAYKATDDFAQREVAFVLSVDGIDIEYGKRLGGNITLDELSRSYDAVFLGLGLGATRPLGIAGEELGGVHDAVRFIEGLRQAADLSTLQVGQSIIVIGGGMTAIDIAVQTKKLGSRDVTIVYRRGPEQMGASAYECELALSNGVTITHWARPEKLSGANGQITGVEFERTILDDDGRLTGTGERFSLAADQVFRAVGQGFDGTCLGNAQIAMQDRRIAVDENRKTSLDNVWAGGDCVAGGADLTVASVEDGNIAAAAINKFLTTGAGK